MAIADSSSTEGSSALTVTLETSAGAAQLDELFGENSEEGVDLVNAVFVSPNEMRSDARASSAPDAHGEKRRRRLDDARGTGGPGAHREAPQIETNEQRLGVDAFEGDVRRVGKPRDCSAQ